MEYLSLDQIFLKEERGKHLTALSQENGIHVCISYISEFSSAKILRECIDDICAFFNISLKWRTRLVLIVDELNNNAIEYGSKKGNTNFLEIRIQKKRGNIKYFYASVSDTGKGEHAKTADEMKYLQKQHQNKNFSEHQSIRGRGLFLIISRLVDRLSFKDSQHGGLVVEVEVEVD